MLVPIAVIQREARSTDSEGRLPTHSGGWSAAASGQPEGGRGLIRSGVLAAATHWRS